MNSWDVTFEENKKKYEKSTARFVVVDENECKGVDYDGLDSMFPGGPNSSGGSFRKLSKRTNLGD